MIILSVWFIPDSPRWLLSKDRPADALHALRRLRTKDEALTGQCEEELAMIQESLHSHVHKAGWGAVFQGSNLRRTMIVLVTFTYQQITGQAFVSTYQTVFYKSNGYAAQAFTYPVINSVLQIVAVVPGMFLVDRLGRRGLLMMSCGAQCTFMLLLAGLGSMNSSNQAIRGFVVACFMLFSMSYNVSFDPILKLIDSLVERASPT